MVGEWLIASGLLVFVAWCVLVSVGFVVVSSVRVAVCLSLAGVSVLSCLLGVGLVVRVLVSVDSSCGVT